MPTYEYYCENCGFEFEEFQSIISEPVRKCPRCGMMTVHRKVSGGIGLIFKGSGFYQTDYVRKSVSDSADNEKDKKKVKSVEDKQKAESIAGKSTAEKEEKKSGPS